MPTYHRSDLARLLATIDKGDFHPIYLVFGERYLCLQAVESIIRHLLPSEQERAALRKIDGESEDVARTIAHLQTYSLFAGRQVVRVQDSKIFFSKIVAKQLWDKAGKEAAEGRSGKAAALLGNMLHAADLASDEQLVSLSPAQWKKLFGFERPADISWCSGLAIPEHRTGPTVSGDAHMLAALEKGFPLGNILVLSAEAVDKRKKLFKKIEEIGAVLDLTVESGVTAAARKSQDEVVRELIVSTLASFGKKAAPGVVDALLERVGFHPVAAVREAEKLALYADDRPMIGHDDIKELIGQTREEAIFQLNDAVASADLGRALELATRLRDSGLHPLALIATLRNLLRKLLFVRALQQKETPRYPPGLSYALFQKGYLTELKQTPLGASSLLEGHPFVLYKTFQQAGNFDIAALQNGLALLLEAEFQLKGSALPPEVILDRFLLTFLERRSIESARLAG